MNGWVMENLKSFPDSAPVSFRQSDHLVGARIRTVETLDIKELTAMTMTPSTRNESGDSGREVR